MLPLQYSRERVYSFLREISRLKDSDFPYQDSREALGKIEAVFTGCQRSLLSLSEKSDPAAVQNMCSESLWLIFIYLPLLGFILRSTNVRNSFEVFGPLLRLARQLLGSDTRLILSSEWDMSPHVYCQIAELPNFVLLGLPASESGNPLLVPLAGHELGHTTWNAHSLHGSYTPLIERTISDEVVRKSGEYSSVFGGTPHDLLMKQNVSAAHVWALMQAEETFCDFVGLRLFAESYLHAFAYLLSPGLAVERSCAYPSMKQRCTNLETAAREYGVSLPHDFGKWFGDGPPAITEAKEAYLLKLADHAALSLVDELIRKAGEIASAAKMPARSDEAIRAVLDAFRIFVPAAGIGSLVNLLNAGWQVYHEADFWRDAPNRPADRVSIINELMLKSIELLEIESLTI